MNPQQQQRLDDLQRHIQADTKLLREYESLLRSEDDPRRLLRIRHDIQRQREAIDGYQRELAELEAAIQAARSTPPPAERSGGVNISGISGSTLNIEGDIVGRDKITHVYQADTAALASVQAELTALRQQLAGTENRLAAGQETILDRLGDLRTLMQEERPSAAAIRSAVDLLPVEERPSTITCTYTLDVADNDQLAFNFDIRYQPDIGIDYDPDSRSATGITLDELAEWSRDAERQRNNGLAPDDMAARQLFDRLLPDGSRSREKYQQALLLSRLLPADIRLVFKLADKQGRLWAMPWELLHDGDVAGLEGGTGGRGFLSLGYPAYRWVPAATSISQATGRIEKALVVAADPTQTLTNLDDEVAWLVEELTGHGIGVDFIGPDDPLLANPGRLAGRLRGQYDLFHFAGHGQFDEYDPLLSALIVGRRQAKEQGLLLTATALAQAALDNRRLKLVVFSACQVGQGAAQDVERPWEVAGLVTGLLQAGVPAAVGMQWNIADAASRRLIEALYGQLLGDGRSLDKALQLARQELFNGDNADWANPILARKHDILAG